MRIVHLSEDDLRAFLGGGAHRSRRSIEHLKLCPKCQEILADRAAQCSLVGDMASKPLDTGLADRVISRIAIRSHRRKTYRMALYTIGALATVSTVVYLVGPELYARAIQPVWSMLISGVGEITSVVLSTIGSLKSLSAGQTLLSFAAIAAILWVGLLDKLASRFRLHKSRA